MAIRSRPLLLLVCAFCMIVLCNSTWSEPGAVASELAEMLFAEDGN